MLQDVTPHWQRAGLIFLMFFRQNKWGSDVIFLFPAGKIPESWVHCCTSKIIF